MKALLWNCRPRQYGSGGCYRNRTSLAGDIHVFLSKGKRDVPKTTRNIPLPLNTPVKGPRVLGNNWNGLWPGLPEKPLFLFGTENLFPNRGNGQPRGSFFGQNGNPFPLWGILTQFNQKRGLAGLVPRGKPIISGNWAPRGNRELDLL